MNRDLLSSMPRSSTLDPQSSAACDLALPLGQVPAIVDPDRRDGTVGSADDLVEADLLLEFGNDHAAIVRMRDQQVDTASGGAVNRPHQRAVAIVGNLLDAGHPHIKRQRLIGVQSSNPVSE